MCKTQFLSEKNVKNLSAHLSLAGIAAAAFLYALGLAGCADNNPADSGGEGKTSALSKGPSPLTLANLEANMVLVEVGVFQIGCRSEYDEKPTWVDANGKDTGGINTTNSLCWPNPAVDTSLDIPFYICRYEVTQGLWEEVMGAIVKNRSEYKGDDLPVTNVTGREMWRFIDTLNNKSGKYIYRLPSEIEWEYAALGGNKNKNCANGCKYSGGGTASAVAWYGGSNGPHPVGGLSHNELGVYDMSGNVWEVAVNNPTSDPQLTLGRGGNHVERGGSWYGKENYSGVTYRKYIGGRGVIDSTYSDRGFRLAATLKP